MEDLRAGIGGQRPPQAQSLAGPTQDEQSNRCHFTPSGVAECRHIT